MDIENTKHYMYMNLIERLFGGGNVPTTVAEIGNQFVTAGMKHREEIWNGMENARNINLFPQDRGNQN